MAAVEQLHGELAAAREREARLQGQLDAAQAGSSSASDLQAQVAWVNAGHAAVQQAVLAASPVRTSSWLCCAACMLRGAPAAAPANAHA